MKSAAGVLLVIASLAVLGLWQSQSVRLLSVASGSMAPLVERGDAVLVRKVDPKTIQIGDMVSYPSLDDSSVIVTHRVVQVLPESGKLIAKGEANATADRPVEMASVVGAVQYVVPGLGRAIDGLHTWPGLALAVYVPTAVVLASEFVRVGRHYLRPTYSLRGYR